MSDRVLETLIKAGASEDVIEEYKKLKIQGPLTSPEPIQPRRKCTEKQLAALAIAREKRRKLK